jgi:hypothetical protein
MIGRFLRTVTTAETLGILLLGFALQILSYGVASSLRTTETGSFLWICLAAAAVSYGMGRRKWRGNQASAGLAALGVALVWILGARLVIPLVSLLREGISLLPQLIPYIRNGTPFDVTAVLEAWTLIAQASSTLWVRLQTWTMGFDTSVAINDPLVRGMVWTLILWL